MSNEKNWKIAETKKFNRDLPEPANSQVTYKPVDLIIGEYKLRISNGIDGDAVADRLAGCWNFLADHPDLDKVEVVSKDGYRCGSCGHSIGHLVCCLDDDAVLPPINAMQGNAVMAARKRWKEVQDAEAAELRSQRDELLAALKEAVECDGETRYEGEDDEIGTRACCYVVSYKPHEASCWVMKSRAAIEKATK